MVEQVAELAMKLSQRHLADYGATRSRHDFTQRQLMSCLILRAYLKTTYRGLLDLLAASPALRERMGLTEKLPHFTTLQKFSSRSQVLAIVRKLVAMIGQSAAAQTSQSTLLLQPQGTALSALGESGSGDSDRQPAARGAGSKPQTDAGLRAGSSPATTGSAGEPVGAERQVSRSDAGRSRFESSGLRPPPSGAHHPPRMVSAEHVHC